MTQPDGIVEFTEPVTPDEFERLAAALNVSTTDTERRWVLNHAHATFRAAMRDPGYATENVVRVEADEAQAMAAWLEEIEWLEA